MSSKAFGDSFAVRPKAKKPAAPRTPPFRKILEHRPTPPKVAFF